MATKDEIKLLEKAICGYLPYKVKAVKNNVIHTITAVNTRYDFCELDEDINEQVEDIKLFLRPMSSMTDDEQKTFNDEYCVINEDAWMERGLVGYINQSKIMAEGIDWLNSHRFDYHGLIEKNFALEAPIGMY